MKILWITNILLPPISEALGLKGTPTGGWMIASLRRLLEAAKSNQYAVATVWPGNKYIRQEINGVVYYLLPLKGNDKTKYCSHLESYWRNIKSEFKPDVVHIHGTEYPFGLSYVKACGSSNVVASIQGIISGYARYYAAGIDFRDVKKCLTLRDLVKHDSLSRQEKNFYTRAKLENELFNSLSYIIGRTEWDKAHAQAMNPNLKYYFCGETLRESFYIHKWTYENCEKFSIFVSQAGYPIKGLHILIKALPLILRSFPQTKIYVGGVDIISVPFYRKTGYGKYLEKLISNLHLEEKVIFTGMLDEKQMCEQYLKSNVFVCPSSIENSPNSLGEAQLLGMPYVASYVGGIPEIVNMNPRVLYRFEEHEMLAKKICDIFLFNGDFIDVSNLTRYDGQKNTCDLINIYSSIHSHETTTDKKGFCQ